MRIAPALTPTPMPAFPAVERPPLPESFVLDTGGVDGSELSVVGVGLVWVVVFVDVGVDVGVADA